MWKVNMVMGSLLNYVIKKIEIKNNDTLSSILLHYKH